MPRKHDPPREEQPATPLAQTNPPPSSEDSPSASAILEIKSLSFRAAQRKYHISYRTWLKIRSGKLDTFRQRRGNSGIHTATISKVLESVKVSPHWNTVVRATQLGLRTQTVQTILETNGLSRHSDRLRYAGFEVQTLSPIVIARQRRIVATAPGSYCSMDFKTFGMVHRRDQPKEVPICGCLCIDQFTSYATVILSESADAALATQTLETHAQSVKSEFGTTVTGLVLTDNGLAFASNEFLLACRRLGLYPRTTRFNHPWSNGKSEALNKTLKYSALPALCTGVFDNVADINALLQGWMHWYNFKRAHSGHMNRGLPPGVLWRLWLKTPGDPFDKLIALGIIQKSDLPHLRVMGAGPDGVPFVTAEMHSRSGVPFAVIIEKRIPFNPLTKPPGETKIYRVERSNVSLAR